MDTITPQGRLTCRTALLPVERAETFARALKASALVTDIAVEQSARARSEARWFVTFLPADAARVEEMREAQQSARAERAATQAFTFVLDEDGERPYLLCHSVQSGQVYEVDLHGRSCTCADFQARCRPNNLDCKHIVASRAAMARGEIGRCQDVPERQSDEVRKRRQREAGEFDSGYRRAL